MIHASSIKWKSTHQKKNQSVMAALVVGVLFLCMTLFSAHAAVVVPGVDGSDGELNITEDTIINLAEAVDGNWNADNTANAGKGIYDPEKWAVVFKYSSVTVDEGVTLSFYNHPSRAPIVWLVTGNVTINGTVSLNGQNYQTSPIHASPGPGGFRGGVGTYAAGATAGAGFGPGGGGRTNNLGYSGSYGTQAENSPERYGNQTLIPLIGGSGGGSDPEREPGGGGGGGAILIACQNSLNLSGIIQANGGAGISENWSGVDPNTSGGSGGGIRLVADTVTGTGTINALGGGGYRTGGLGRIRIERVVNNNTLTVVPDPSLVSLPSDATALIWPPSDAPTVTIISIGGEESPADPRASFGTIGADIVLPEVSTTQIVIETTHVEAESQVEVRVTPRFNANYSVVNATMDSTVATDPLTIRWVADLPVSIGYSAVQVKVIRP